MTLRDLFMQAHWYSQKGAFIIETKSIQCIYIEARYVQKTEGRKNNEGMSVGIADSDPLFPEDIVASYAAGNTHPEDPDNEKTEDTALDALLEHRAGDPSDKSSGSWYTFTLSVYWKRTIWSARWISLAA